MADRWVASFAWKPPNLGMALTMTSKRELADLVTELAEVFERNGGPARREGWPVHLRSVADKLRSGESVDLAEFHRQLSGGMDSMAQSDGEEVWELVEEIASVLPSKYPAQARSETR